MANDSPSPIKLISECFIRPKRITSKKPYYLAPSDIGFFPLQHLQKGLLYSKPQPNFNIEPLVDKLKTALSQALHHFYPLAGQFATVVLEDGDTCWIYLDCNKGPGARFIHATCTAVSVADVVSSPQHVIPLIRSFFELGETDVANYDGHTRPLLSVQVTEIIDAVFIGFTMNHSVVDGTSFWHFVNTMSEIFKSIDEMSQKNITISHPPIIKEVMPDGYGPIIKFSFKRLMNYISQFRVVFDPNLRERIFHFSASSIAKLKALANANTNAKISSFQSLSALVWRSLIRARNLDGDLETSCMLAADARTRFKPPLSMNHVGNLILPIQAFCKVGELLKNELDWGATILNQAIASIDQKTVRNRGQELLDAFLGPQPDSADSIVGGESAVVIGGSVRFNMYGPEFGLGRVVAVRTGYAAKTDGKVTASSGRDGDGSVDLEISLLPEAMSALGQDQEFMSFVS